MTAALTGNAAARPTATEVGHLTAFVVGLAAGALAATRRLAARVAELEHRSPVGEGDLASLRHDIAQALRHVAVVRYDAFGDMGGRLSFSAALVDDGRDVPAGRDEGVEGGARLVAEADGLLTLTEGAAAFFDKRDPVYPD